MPNRKLNLILYRGSQWGVVCNLIIVEVYEDTNIEFKKEVGQRFEANDLGENNLSVRLVLHNDGPRS